MSLQFLAPGVATWTGGFSLCQPDHCLCMNLARSFSVTRCAKGAPYLGSYYVIFGSESNKMPVYEYSCKKCGRLVEVYQRISEPPLKKCKHCSGKLQKLISHSSFHLKGTGWYATDYTNGSGGLASSTQERAKKTSEEKRKQKANKPSSSKEGSNSV